MPDMLVNLLKLPSLDRLPDEGINIRRAQPFEITAVREFIEQNFSLTWADEISVGLPISRYRSSSPRARGG